MTITAAKAVKMERRKVFAGKLIDEKIPNATPVLRTYVMLKNLSITVADSFRSNRLGTQALVQRSRISVARTKKRYGKCLWNLNDIGSVYLAGWSGYHALWYS